MPQGVDDFTIVLPQLTDMVTCGVKAYDELDQLWRMVERYKMTAPLAIKVVDNKVFWTVPRLLLPLFSFIFFLLSSFYFFLASSFFFLQLPSVFLSIRGNATPL